MDKASIVILHYQGEDDTLCCIDSILKNHINNKQFNIILVINSSFEKDTNENKNSFVSRIQKEYPHLIIIENDENTGYSRGNNIGIKKALDLGSEYVLLLNNDTIVSPDLLDKLIAFIKSDTQIGIVSPKIYFAKGYEYHKDKYREEDLGKVIWYAGGKLDWNNIYASHVGVDEVDKGQYEVSGGTDFATGCAMLIKKNTIERIGLFDEKYFLYFEDIDYCMRVKKSGMKIKYFPGTYIWHKNASSSGKPGSNTHIYYQNRNRLYFGFKYASFRTKKSLFIDSIKLVAKGGVYTKSILDYYVGRMGKANL